MIHTPTSVEVWQFKIPQMKRTMNALELKLKLIQHIAEIEDVHLLQRMQAFLNTSGTLYNKKINEIPSLRNNKESAFNDKEDFTGYIKEWVKEM